jgi:hypothetical protein
MKANEHIEKLKALGVFEAFERNLKSGLIIRTIQEYIGYFENNHITFKRFVSCAFTWDETPEGHNFWSNIVKNNL